MLIFEELGTLGIHQDDTTGVDKGETLAQALRTIGRPNRKREENVGDVRREFENDVHRQSVSPFDPKFFNEPAEFLVFLYDLLERVRLGFGS